MTDQTIKADAGKPQLHRVPTQIVRDIAEVREYGTVKYGDTDSWRRVELVRYVDAMYRHMLAFIDDPYGCDAESGIPHYKHMVCNAAFICEHMKGNAIEEKPAVCNAPRGRWKEDAHGNIRCSECWATAACDCDGDWSMTAFCPSCGAIMGKEVT